ncbi:MAG: DUF1273 domain-containing protein [Prevotella sp.]|nr:DUF1273 domain-containing protein [Alistipes senegalensis]MCM1357825.1 DUF1273 domain-containing protein [Prevotella sp.]MCM1474310.1 DUF1273 domain-containing protein [Muribaculaceae bacterium]MDE6427265.1 DUF1273 domain-containing protein [Ruminococcus sp.]
MKSLISGVEVLPASAVSTDIKKTVCITGHRTNRITLYRNNPVLTYSAVKLMLYRYIDMAIEAGYENFINGLAGGIDLWSAEYVIMKKRRNDRIKLISAMPFMHHADFMPENDRFLLENVEKNSDYLITVNSNPDITYSKHKSADRSDTLYRDRNYYMVDHSSAVIAFADNEYKHSGTFQTINYAYRNGRKICSFSTEKIHSIIEKSNSDIRTIGYEIALLENVFCT